MKNLKSVYIFVQTTKDAIECTYIPLMGTYKLKIEELKFAIPFQKGQKLGHHWLLC